MTAVKQVFDENRVVDLGPLPAPRLATNATVHHALLMLQRARRGGVVVLDGSTPVGLFTERDLTHLLADGFSPRGSQRHTPLKKVMRKPVTVQRSDSLATALATLHGHRVRHLVVVDSRGELRGLLTSADLLQFVVDQFPEETVNLPPRLRQQFHHPEGA